MSKKDKKKSKNLEQDDIMEKILNCQLYFTPKEVENEEENNHDKIFLAKSPSIADVRFSKSFSTINNESNKESASQKHLSKSSNSLYTKIENGNDNFDTKLKKLQNQRVDPIISAATKINRSSSDPSKIGKDKNSSNTEEKNGDRGFYTFPPLGNALNSSLQSDEHYGQEGLEKEDNNISDDYAKEIFTESAGRYSDQVIGKEIIEIETIMQYDQDIKKPNLDLSKVRNTVLLYKLIEMIDIT